MSKRDQLTGQGPQRGNKRSHALNHSRRTWNVNLQTTRLTLSNGETVKVKVSAKTLKTLRKNAKTNTKKTKSQTVA